MVATQQLFSSDVLLGEAAKFCLLRTQLAVFMGYDNFTRMRLPLLFFSFSFSF
jgi:hypothetical protein